MGSLSDIYQPYLAWCLALIQFHSDSLLSEVGIPEYYFQRNWFNWLRFFSIKPNNRLQTHWLTVFIDLCRIVMLVFGFAKKKSTFILLRFLLFVSPIMRLKMKFMRFLFFLLRTCYRFKRLLLSSFYLQ